ncbi:hypothetical protein [Ramlibacter sp.]|uniref:hypothetical protein n=1 Tax=Ramlibacter sp. TaxID=1917967 RepID=UPI002D512E0B|nr:hypothetical protein [Ramlibacter sp.]HYD75077.1 hypothetical protein [Ramlibacter sp.]
MTALTKAPKLSGTLCGIAGEYFVAAELSRRGYIASITLRNTRGVDILASNADATRSVGIQVKSSQGSSKSWMLTSKVEADAATNLFFVFVRLNGLSQPEYYVVPREDVSRFAAENHKQWLATPGKKGQAHRDTPIRQFKDVEDKFRGRWDLLGLD